MIEWLISLIPWPVWLIAAGLAVVAVQVTFGWKAAIAAAVPLLAVLGFGWAQNMGAERERNRNLKRQIDAVKTRKEVDDEIANLGHADVDSGLKRWLRDHSDE
jgi:hypothetical protein